MSDNPYRLYPIILILALLLAGCNLDASGEEDVTYIIVTSTPDPALVTVAPSQTPTPEITPTPTTPPDVFLRIADRDLVNGYYENAVYAYQTLVAQGDGIPADIRASAVIGLGQAALKEGLFNEAVNAFTTFITQFPEDSRIAQVHFLRGDAYLGTSAWSQALADFQQYLTLRPGLIDSYTQERIGDAQLALGQTADALASYQLATEANRNLVQQLILREKVAQVYSNAGQPDKALEQYTAILAVAENAAYRATIDYAAAQVLLGARDTENGLARLEMIFNTYGETVSAYQAMITLLENGYTLDDYQQGIVSYHYGDYPRAIEAFNRYTSSTLLESIPPDLYLMLGQSYREVGSTSAAITTFQTIVEQYPQDPLFGEALLEQGRTYFLSGAIPAAIAHYLSIADNYGYVSEAAEALWRAGYLYGTNGDPAQSRAVFERLAEAYPNTEQASSGLFIAASSAVNAGDTAGAERLFGILAMTTTGDDQAAAYLSVGQLALQRGDSNAADAAFRMAREAAPDSYYSARAQDIIENRVPFEKPLSYQFEFDDAAQLAEAENWLRQTFTITQEDALWPLSAALENDPRLIRGRELWAVGAYTEAEEEFAAITDEMRETGNALASYQLAIFLRSITAYRSSIIAAADIIKAANIATTTAPAYIARMRYPAYYQDIVVEIANKRDFSPLLLFSLIRHESLFDTNATAAAGEKGLTQVIPSTGEYIATQLDWPNYQHSDLFRPYAGIEFGAYYLDEQLDRFDQNVPVALAGYNAGPGRAANWLELSGDDPDLFMATITIDSTRLYVQRIYGYYTIYRTLYGVG